MILFQGDAPFPFKTENDQDPVTYKESRSNSTNTVVITTAQVHHPNQEVNLEQVNHYSFKDLPFY